MSARQYLGLSSSAVSRQGEPQQHLDPSDTRGVRRLELTVAQPQEPQRRVVEVVVALELAAELVAGHAGLLPRPLLAYPGHPFVWPSEWPRAAAEVQPRYFRMPLPRVVTLAKRRAASALLSWLSTPQVSVG